MEPHIIELTDNCEIYELIDLKNYPFDEFFSESDHLILILEGQMFEGDLIDATKDRIELKNVREHKNPNKLGGIYFFYRNELLQIRRTSTAVKKSKLIKPQDTHSALGIQICEDEYNRYKEMSRNFIFIQKSDKMYKEAILKLNETKTLGTVALGVEDNRSLGIGLLVLSTWKIVYLFDITSLKCNQFYPEIKQILENESVCKVFHRGGPQIDVLQKIYNVSVNNVTDTEITDLIIEKNKAGGSSLQKTRNISECLTIYFNIPSSLLQDALKTKNFKWFNRPLSHRRLVYAAQLGTYLILLKERMEKLMLREVQQAVYNVCDYYSNLNDFAFVKKNQMTEAAEDIKPLIPILSRHGINSDEKIKPEINNSENINQDNVTLATSAMEALKLDDHQEFILKCIERKAYHELSRKKAKIKEKKDKKAPISLRQKFDRESREAWLMEWGY